MGKKRNREQRRKAQWQRRDREMARKAQEDQDAPSINVDLQMDMEAFNEAMSQVGVAANDAGESFAEMSREQRINNLQDQNDALARLLVCAAERYQEVTGDLLEIDDERLHRAQDQKKSLEYHTRWDTRRTIVTIGPKPPALAKPIFDWDSEPAVGLQYRKSDWGPY